MKKKVLLTGILSIVMCLSLIAGATFALFTSESKVNIAVTSGKVDVVAYVDVDSVEYKAIENTNWTAATNGYAAFDGMGSYATVTEEKVLLNNIVPGDALRFNVVIENNSTVNVKARTLIENDLAKDTGLFGLLNVKVGNDTFDGAIITEWDTIYYNSEDVIIPVEIELPVGVKTGEGLACDINVVVQAVQSNASVKNSFNENEDGTYSITDKYGLISFQKSVNAGEQYEGKTVILEDNIDLSYINWTPMGVSETVGFRGTFDGNEKTISNLTASGSTYVGLFGAFGGQGSTPIIKDLTIANATVTGESRVGALYGWSYGGTVTNCHVVGDIKVSGNYQVGAFAGANSSDVSGCSVNANEGSFVKAEYVKANLEGDNAGAFIGYMNNGTETDKVVVSNCTVSGLTVEGTRKVGGAIGYVNYYNVIENVNVENVAVATNTSDEYAETNAISIAGFVGEVSAVQDVNISGTAKNVKVLGVQADYTDAGYGRLRNEATGITKNINIETEQVSVAIQLGAITYDSISGIQGKTLTIKGVGNDTKLNMNSVWNVGGANLTFEDLYIEGFNGNTFSGYGIQSTTGAIKYVNCTINNCFTNEFYGTVEYNKCTFTGTCYNYTYSVKEAKFIDCTFDKEDSRALIVYSHGDNPINVLVENCTFTAKKPGYTWSNDWVAAIEVDTTNIKTAGTTVTVKNCTYNEQFSNIVRDKSSANATPAVITVEGVVVSRKVEDAEQFTEWIKENGNTINEDVVIELADGNYTSNFEIAGGKEVTICGTKDVVLDGQIATTASNKGTLYIKGITINVDDKIVDSTGISQTGKSGIAIWGDQTVICEDVTFNITLADATAITSWWDTGVGTTIIVRNCTFNCNGQRPIRATGNVTVENCTFNDPYRYAVQLTAKTSTATEMDKAIINFNNNTIVNGDGGKAFVYGIQLEGADYGCHDLVINGKGNTIENGGTESTMYYCECGKVDHDTITWNVETTPVHEKQQ